eukprot:1812791-Alexandrium_andersonii.AAC.1
MARLFGGLLAQHSLDAVPFLEERGTPALGEVPSASLSGASEAPGGAAEGSEPMDEDIDWFIMNQQ